MALGPRGRGEERRARGPSAMPVEVPLERWVRQRGGAEASERWRHGRLRRCRSRWRFRGAHAPQAQARRHQSGQAHDPRGSSGTSQTRREPSSRFRGDSAVPSSARSAEPLTDSGARLGSMKADGSRTRRAALPNVRAKGGDDGRAPGPGWRKCTVYRRPGPGGLPVALPLSEGLGRTA